MIVNLQHDTASRVGEEMRMAWRTRRALYLTSEVLDIPPCHFYRFLGLICKMLYFHGPQGTIWNPSGKESLKKLNITTSASAISDLKVAEYLDRGLPGERCRGELAFRRRDARIRVLSMTLKMSEYVPRKLLNHD